MMALILSACSPKVTTNIVRDYSKRVSPQQVKIYEVGDTVPYGAEYIGNVMVTADRSPASKCRYEKVIDMAVKATADNGGNILSLTSHKLPGGSDACHEISGDIMWDGDTTYVHPNTTYVRSDTAQVHSDTAPSAQTFTLTKNTFYINAGYGNVSSKLYIASEHKAPSSASRGIDFNIGYDYMLNRLIGIGVQYSGFKGTVSIGPDCSHYLISLVGPHLVLRQQIGEGRFLLEERLCIGYYNLFQWAYGLTTQNHGLGSSIQLGVEYLLNEKVGLAFSIGSVSGSLNNDSVELPDDEKSGIGRLYVDMGFRYHF